MGFRKVEADITTVSVDRNISEYLRAMCRKRCVGISVVGCRNPRGPQFASCDEATFDRRGSVVRVVHDSL